MNVDLHIWSVPGGVGHVLPGVLYGCRQHFDVVSFPDVGVQCCSYVPLDLDLHHVLGSSYADDAIRDIIFGWHLPYGPSFVLVFECRWLVPASGSPSRQAGRGWFKGGAPPWRLPRFPRLGRENSELLSSICGGGLLRSKLNRKVSHHLPVVVGCSQGCVPPRFCASGEMTLIWYLP